MSKSIGIICNDLNNNSSLSEEICSMYKNGASSAAFKKMLWGDLKLWCLVFYNGTKIYGVYRLEGNNAVSIVSLLDALAKAGVVVSVQRHT